MRLLLSDLDGTMFPLGGKPSRKTLRRLKEIIKDNPRLRIGYVTGRSLLLFLEILREKGIPKPDMMITDVGTKVFYKRDGVWVEDIEYKFLLQKEWPESTEQKVLGLMRGIEGLQPQEKRKQARFKVSFYLEESHSNKALNKINRLLKRNNVSYTLIISKGLEKSLLVDILPSNASKKRSIEYLVKKIGLPPDRVLFAGDSFNDFPALTSGYLSVVVANAREELKRKVKLTARKRSILPTVYFANGNYDCGKGENLDGVIEGLIHFGFLSEEKGYYIQLHSPHGLLNAKYTDLGRDEDTGGQIVYVIELAKALSSLDEVRKVEIFTRHIADERYPNYRKRIEHITPKARIVRIPFGGKRYMKKTRLWPFIEEYVNNAYLHCMKNKKVPDIIHSHYADAGWACIQLSEICDVPQVHTSHSLGYPKMKNMNVNKANIVRYNKTFHFTTRLAAEQATMDNSRAIIVSTKEERKEQYSYYHVNRKKFHVIPPGIDTKIFYPYTEKIPRKEKKAYQEVKEILTKYLSSPSKPVVLAISRMDRRKNVPALLKAFALDENIWKNANLVILTGIRRKPDREQKMVYDELKSILKKNPWLRGRVALVKFIHLDKGLGPLYRLAARSRGVFVNPALIEPFGLTILEAGACGLPVVATSEGGPSEIITSGKNGLLVDPNSIRDIAVAIRLLLEDRKLWNKISKNGISNIKRRSSWNAAARAHLRVYKSIIRQRELKSIRRAFTFLKV